MPPPTEIESEIQLLVEGKDQKHFFEAFLERLSFGNVQVQDFGGVKDLRSFLSILVKRSEFREIVQSVGVVRDAEDSAQAAFQSVQDSLKNAGLSVPKRSEERAGCGPAVTVLILPDNDHPGMLETLLCRSFAETEENRCIDGFFQCVKALDISIEPSDKARAHAYLATKSDPRVSVGVAAKKDYWDLEHDAFGNVRCFLRKLSQAPGA